MDSVELHPRVRRDEGRFFWHELDFKRSPFELCFISFCQIDAKKKERIFRMNSRIRKV